MRIPFLLFFLSLLGCVHAADFIEVPEIAAAFDKAGLKGTFVLLDSDGTLRGHDEARAKTRYVPASTFKIPNSLIGLDAGVVSSVDEILPYGGKPQFMKEWEHDDGAFETPSRYPTSPSTRNSPAASASNE